MDGERRHRRIVMLNGARLSGEVVGLEDLDERICAARDDLAARAMRRRTWSAGLGEAQHVARQCTTRRRQKQQRHVAPPREARWRHDRAVGGAAYLPSGV
jgi:hypothetical protein